MKNSPRAPDELEKLAVETFNEHTLAGLALGVVRDARSSTSWGFGLADVMRERIFDPLGMAHADFVRSNRVREPLAVGYALRLRGRMKPVKDLEIAVAPAGWCYSSTEDMARYVAALLRGGEPLVRRETLEQMLAPPPGHRAGLPHIGLSFFVEPMAGHRVAGHDGGWAGFVSAMLLAPDDGAGVLAFTNTSTQPAPHFLAERVLRRVIGAPEPDDPVIPEAPFLWPELTGIYRPSPGLKTNLRVWPLIGGEAEVLVSKGHLAVRAQSPLRPLRRGVRLRAADPDDPLVFEARHGDVRIPLAFERGADGRVEALHAATALGGFARLRRRPRATSVRLWSRVAGSATAGAAAAAAVRRRRRRRTPPRALRRR